MRRSARIGSSRFGIGACARRTLYAAVLLGLTLTSSAASAGPILFSFEGQAVGTLDGMPFDGSFAVEVAADTDAVEVFQAAINVLHFVEGTATIELPIGSGAFLFPGRVTSIQPFGIGVTAAIQFGSVADLFALGDPAIDGYLLDGALGPLRSTSPGLVVRNVSLDVGQLRLTELSEMTFTATPIPEPSTGCLIGLGLIALYRRGRRVIR